MSTITNPVVDITCINASVANGGNFAGAAAASPARQSSFLQPNLLSWIDTPYYHIPLTMPKLQNATCLNLPEEASQTAEQTEQATEEKAANQNEYSQNVDPSLPAPESPVLDGFDLDRLAPPLQEVASDSHINHVQQVIAFFQKGGDSAKTFGKIFLNDLALQKTILNALMDEPGNPLSQINFLHKELALRLASCYQARQVAQLLLADI